MIAVREFEPRASSSCWPRESRLHQEDAAVGLLARPAPTGSSPSTSRKGDELLAAALSGGRRRDLHGHGARPVDPLPRVRRAADGPHRPRRHRHPLAKGDRWSRWSVLSGKPTSCPSPENGYGKRTPVEEYRLQGRGGSGIINIRPSRATATSSACMAVGECRDEILMITSQGQADPLPRRRRQPHGPRHPGREAAACRRAGTTSWPRPSAPRKRRRCGTRRTTGRRGTRPNPTETTAAWRGESMKFFIDTANVNEIREAASLGVLDGVTTNPSLVAKEGKDFHTVLREIVSIVNGPISAEVTATDKDGMMERGPRAGASIHPNIVDQGAADRGRGFRPARPCAAKASRSTSRCASRRARPCSRRRPARPTSARSSAAWTTSRTTAWSWSA